MFWQIVSFPICEHHVFLSHCAADRDWLIHPVYDHLTRRGVVPWLDRDDYYYGRDSRTALRDGLLKSRHVVFFVTRAMLEYSRGWTALELAFADILQSNLTYRGGPLVNVILPLFFVDPADSDLSRFIGRPYATVVDSMRPAMAMPSFGRSIRLKPFCIASNGWRWISARSSFRDRRFTTIWPAAPA